VFGGTDVANDRPNVIIIRKAPMREIPWVIGDDDLNVHRK
jgi:hypothetical protein